MRWERSSPAGFRFFQNRCPLRGPPQADGCASGLGQSQLKKMRASGLRRNFPDLEESLRVLLSPDSF